MTGRRASFSVRSPQASTALSEVARLRGRLAKARACAAAREGELRILQSRVDELRIHQLWVGRTEDSSVKQGDVMGEQIRGAFAALAVGALSIALAGCGGTAEELQAADELWPADDSVSSASQGLSSTLSIGSTLVTTDNLNLRTGPGTTYPVTLVIPAGARVSTVNRTTPANGFYNIIYGKTVGWSSGLYLAVASLPSAHSLDTSVVSKIVEPPGSGRDDQSAYYTDLSYWNFCVPGTVTAALSYFTSNVIQWPAGYFKEPYGPYITSTYWTSSDSVSGYSTVGRAYLMHIAMQSKPPSFSSPGLASFASYPSTGATLAGSRDVLNWEASGHASGWQNFFYQVVGASGLSAATLHGDIKRDIYGGHAVLTSVNTAYLPNWSRSLGHSIAVIGYDDSAGTYRYVDTCGARCNGSSQATNGGVWTISQSRLYSAIVSHGTGYVR
jgi:hypothetical protein